MKTVADVRDRARLGVRDVVLDAARQVTLEQGWRAVRIGALATQVGLSRQSVHLVFGTKAQLGSDLVHREIEQLLTGIGAALDAHPGDPLACIREAATVTLTSMAENPLLQIIISGTNSPMVHVMTWIPLFTPFTVLARLGTGIPTWEIVGSGAVLLAFIAVEFVMLGRVFRASILAGAGRPSFKTVLLRMRQA